MKKVFQWWKRWRCRHTWRPARTSYGPAKHCAGCDTTIQLSDAEFYAQFERIPHFI